MLIQLQVSIRAREPTPGGTSAVYWQPGVFVHMRANFCARRAAADACSGATVFTVLPAAVH